jgi:hypothetical protein
MPSDQELIRPAGSKQFDSDKDWSHHDGMEAVHAQRVDRLQVGQRLAILSRESHVPAHLANGTARLHAADDVTIGQVLMLETHFGPRKNARFIQAPPDAPGENQTPTCQQFASCLHPKASLSS